MSSCYGSVARTNKRLRKPLVLAGGTAAIRQVPLMAGKTRPVNAFELQVRNTLQSLTADRRLCAARPPVGTGDSVVVDDPKRPIDKRIGQAKSRYLAETQVHRRPLEGLNRRRRTNAGANASISTGIAAQ
jgi:hypothetical protein